MSENDTFEFSVDEAEEIILDEGSNSSSVEFRIEYEIEAFYLPFLIVIGVSSSLLVLTILIRHRLWIRHEAYIYLAAILIVNINKLIVYHGDMLLVVFHLRHLRLPLAADVLCKCWTWLFVMFGYIHWLYVLLLLNVFLRLQQPVTSSDRRGFWANLSAKYCSLFGTKVIVSSFFIVCTLSSFWTFAITALVNFGMFWHCTSSFLDYETRFFKLKKATWYLKVCIPVLTEAVLLMLIILNRKVRSGTVFRQMNGASRDNGDAAGMTRIAVICAVAAFITSVPIFLDDVLHYTRLSRQFSRTFLINLSIATHLFYLIHPLTLSVVCLTVKSGFRDELKTIFERCCCRCCRGSRCHRTLPAAEPANNGSSVIQMNPIDEDSTVARRDEDSDITIHQK